MIIYRINFPNGKYYIGQTRSSVKRRFSNHIYHMNKGTKTPLYDAMRKYKLENIQITEICSALSREFLNELEIEFIEKLSLYPRGYNLERGGTKSIWNEESRKKLSKAKKGKKYLTKEHYKKLSDKFTGSGNPFHNRTHSEEAREKISKARKNTTLSDKTRLAISKAHGGSTIQVFTKDTLKFIGEYPSASDCARQLNLNVGHVCSCIRGNTKLKSHKGFIYKRVSNDRT